MKKLRIGVAGLGRAFSLMAPALRDPRVQLVAAADPRAEARAKFEADFQGKTFDRVEALCADPGIDDTPRDGLIDECQINGSCSADFNYDGDIGTDADIEDFFDCLAGNCCATCPPDADFDGDGDVGTDQDIEAFFRVLAGGYCPGD